MTLEERDALNARLGAASYQAIGEKLGVSAMTAWRRVQSALKKTIQEPADAVRKMELARLDRVFLAIFSSAAAGDAKAIDTVLKIMKRRAELLGLDVPQRHEVAGLESLGAPQVHIYIPDNSRGIPLTPDDDVEVIDVGGNGSRS
jgi:hypothetical protein